MEGSRRGRRSKDKLPVIEENTNYEYIDVDEYLGDDFNMDDLIWPDLDNLDMGLSYSGLRRSKRTRGKNPVIEDNTTEEDTDEDESDEDIIGSPIVNKSTSSSATGTSGVNNVKIENDGKRTRQKQIPENAFEKGDMKKPKTETSNRSPAKQIKGNGSSSYTFQTRTSPKALFNAVSTLTPVQQSCLEQLGFGKLLDFKVDGTPSRLGFYVVDNFDPKKMVIKLDKERIEISLESIAEIVGVVNEGVDIMERDVINDKVMIKNWKDQFKGIKDITPNAVKHVIRQSEVADMNFK